VNDSPSQPSHPPRRARGSLLVVLLGCVLVATFGTLGAWAGPADPAAPGLLYDASADSPDPPGWQPTAGNPGPEWASTTERRGREYMTQRITPSEGPVLEGTHAYRLETRGEDDGAYDEDYDCDCERAELANGNPTRAGYGGRLLGEGDDVYYGFALFLPSSHVLGEWQTYFQSKSVAPSGVPETALHIERGRWTLGNYDEPSRHIRKSPFAVASRGGWHRFVIRIRYSSSYSKGIQEVWHAEGAGGPLTKKVSRVTHTLERGKANHPRVGYYHSPLRGRTSHVFLDAFRAGRTFSSVAP